MASYALPTYQLGSTLVQPAINVSKRGDLSAVSLNSIATVLTPSTGKRFVFFGGNISVSADASVLFEDNASGVLVFRTPLLLAKYPFYFDIGLPYTATAVDNVLKGTASANATITGMLYYAEI